MSVLTLRTLIRRVDLFTLKLFLATIEEGQIGRAAAREHIAPSAATKRIQDLEDVTGTRLFDRSRRGVAPSAAGLVLARHIRTILATLDDMRLELAAFTDGIRGHIAIAAPGLLIVQFLAREIAEFTRQFPQVEVELHQESNPGALQSLLSGEVDLAVYSRNLDANYDGIESIECRTDRLVAIVPAGHPLAGRGSMTLEMLVEQDLIGLGPSTSVMTNLRHAARQIGREPRVKFTVSSIEAARSLVGAGLGVGLQPGSMLFLDEHDRVATVPIEGTWAERSYLAAKLVGKSLTPAAEALMEQLTLSARTIDAAAECPVRTQEAH
jgi:DNA-binding transcriptional LysR family regulator